MGGMGSASAEWFPHTDYLITVEKNHSCKIKSG